MLKKNKTLFITFTILFLVFALSSGADNTWFEIFIMSTLYGLATTLLIFLVYRVFQFISFVVKKEYN